MQDNNTTPKKPKKFNKVTTEYMNRVRAGEIDKLYINEDGLIDTYDPELKARNKAMADKIRNKPKKLFQQAEYLSQEGHFKIKLIAKNNFKTVYGTILIFKVISTLIPSTYNSYSEIENDFIDNDKLYKAGFFEESVTLTEEDTLPDMDTLITMLQPEDECIIRLSPNYRGTKFYIRYLEFKEDRVGRREE